MKIKTSSKYHLKQVKAKDMPEMEQKLYACKERLGFLVDFTSFTHHEINLNSEVFKWHDRMDRVFEDHERIVSEKQNQYQEGLKVTCRLKIYMGLQLPFLLLE